MHSTRKIKTEKKQFYNFDAVVSNPNRNRLEKSFPNRFDKMASFFFELKMRSDAFYC